MTCFSKRLFPLLLLALASCGGLATTGERTESHWLRECTSDEQCVVGACWCGRCTRRCDAVVDCPHPLDQCVAPGVGLLDDSCDVPKGGLCSILNEDVLESAQALEERVVNQCDGARPTLFSVMMNMSGQFRAIPIGGHEYFLFAGGSLLSGVTRVDTAGNVLQLLPGPSDLSPEIEDVMLLDDGRVALAGRTSSFSGNRGWIGVVDANWQLLWERELERVGGNDLVQLEDGDLVVSGTRYDYTVMDPNGGPQPWLGMARLDLDGNLKWEVDRRIEGHQGLDWVRLLAVVAGRARAFAQTANGFVMVTADDEGDLTERLLDTRSSYLQGVVALPAERFATASSRAPGAVVSVFEADGALVWEKTYGRETHAEPSGIAYDPTREQIVVPGSYRGTDGGRTRTWMIATDLDSNQKWELTRLPQEIKGVEGRVASVSPNRGPELRDVTVGPDGTLVAPGFTSVDLTFFVVGPSACE